MKMNRVLNVCTAAFVAAVALAACGGGGGGGGYTPPTGNPSTSPTPTVAPTQTPSTTTAQGTLVDDASNTPLSGVTVRLDPWIVYPTPGPTPTPILTTTTDANGHFTITAPNGTYMLVIGPDAVNTPPPGFTPQPPCTASPCVYDTPIPGASGWYATVHDRVVLNGQTTLVAPTLPPGPSYTPPPAETSGNYRLATLDPLTEAPCILAYNQERASVGLPAAVADEWLTESAREIVNGSMAGGSSEPLIVGEYGWTDVSGGNACANMDFASQFQSPSQAASASAAWFGGRYDKYTTQTSGFGFQAAPEDPRIYTQVNVNGNLTWP